MGAGMPDISMCGNDDCKVRMKCYRNPASGTTPSGRRQSWMMFSYDERLGCEAFWPTPPGVYEAGASEPVVPAVGGES